MLFNQKVMLCARIFTILILINAVTSHSLRTLDDDPTRFQLFSDETQNKNIKDDEQTNPGRVTRNTVFIAPKFVPLEIDNRNHESFIVERLSDIDYDYSGSEEEEEEMLIDVVEVPPGALANQYFRRSNLEKRDSGYPEEFLTETLERDKANETEETVVDAENLTNLKNGLDSMLKTEPTSPTTSSTTPRAKNDCHIDPSLLDLSKKVLHNKIKNSIPSLKHLSLLASKTFHKLENPSKSTSIPPLDQSINSDEHVSSNLSPAFYADVEKSIQDQHMARNEPSDARHAPRWRINPFLKYLFSRLRKGSVSKKFYPRNQLYPLLFKYRHKK